MADTFLQVPREFRRGGRADDEQSSVESGAELIRLICRKLGLDDLGGSDVLDMGCGNKLVQAILGEDMPVGSYVGIDVHRPLIEFLQENVDDPRFSFYPLDVHNDMYNPEGEPLSEHTPLPVPEAGFDVICLFSVFTHLAAHDYTAMLKLLRRYARPDARIIYSLFVNETTPGGHGWVDRMVPFIEAAITEENVNKPPADFVDWVPEKPLWRAVYSRKHALDLVQGTGWEVESLNDPEEYIQHYMICKPV
jgi:SAM-dependent methyltransferase